MAIRYAIATLQETTLIASVYAFRALLYTRVSPPLPHLLIYKPHDYFKVVAAHQT
ncbi:MAG: hypothetical protein RMX68_023825 [Aulosira sp. ZfuVER01]|nr:hypothetical protein [Aulosira sp. ZfuVER01]MDZ7998439.1 hypothetical protein [Aulosira sp. DedVER01a]MDZ8050217.1 hypothetical protein [Aulosira sp. ZfuCHP01]